MAIGFFLKVDVLISRSGSEDEPIKPLKEIDDVERDIPKFFHLGGMDGFVVKQSYRLFLRFSFPTIPPDDEMTEKVYRHELPKWKPS